MPKSGKNLSEGRKAKVLAARRRNLKIEEQAKYAGPTNENGAPIVVSQSLQFAACQKSEFPRRD